MDKQQLAVVAVFVTGAWVAWLIFNAVRQYVLARSQTAAQDKLLLRVSSPESLQVFLASRPGAEFLRSLERSPNEDWRSIIRTAQTAVTCPRQFRQMPWECWFALYNAGRPP